MNERHEPSSEIDWALTRVWSKHPHCSQAFVATLMTKSNDSLSLSRFHPKIDTYIDHSVPHDGLLLWASKDSKDFPRQTDGEHRCCWSKPNWTPAKNRSLSRRRKNIDSSSMTSELIDQNTSIRRCSRSNGIGHRCLLLRKTMLK